MLAAPNFGMSPYGNTESTTMLLHHRLFFHRSATAILINTLETSTIIWNVCSGSTNSLKLQSGNFAPCRQIQLATRRTLGASGQVPVGIRYRLNSCRF